MNAHSNAHSCEECPRNAHSCEECARNAFECPTNAFECPRNGEECPRNVLGMVGGGGEGHVEFRSSDLSFKECSFKESAAEGVVSWHVSSTLLVDGCGCSSGGAFGLRARVSSG